MITCQVCDKTFDLDEYHAGYENKPLCEGCYSKDPKKYGSLPWLTMRWILNLLDNPIDIKESNAHT